MIEYEHVGGDNRGSIRLFALSTCVWCKRTKQFLNKLNVAFDYVYVDTLKGGKRREAISEVEKQNPRCSFPTLVINDKECIIGFKKDKIKEVLGFE